MNIIRHKAIFFAISLIIIIPGVISLLLFGLNKSIDFTGGSQIEFSVGKKITNQEITNLFSKENIKVYSIQTISANQFVVRTNAISQSTHEKLTSDLEGFNNYKEEDFETIGPTISSEITKNAFYSVAAASVLIVLYIAWSFRKVPKPASSWRFGICAIIALLHDVLVLLGIFSLLGHFFNIQIDSLFVTAVLTVIGFSVHDTIVVFDRIRENLRRTSGPFEQIVNESILQTLGRSLNTSLTVLLVLFALLLFGGDSIRWFVVALLIGITSGTYSSIFNASPLLVVWHEWSLKRKKA